MAGQLFRNVDKGDEVQLKFGDAEGIQTPSFLPGDFGKFGPALIFSSMSVRQPGWFGLKGKELERYRDDNEDSSLPAIDEARERAVTFDLGPMDKPFAAMRQCTDNQLQEWGIDLARHGALSKKVEPVTSPGTGLVSSDYPIALLRAGQQGLVQFRLMVDETGKAESCHIQQSTRPKEFDDIVCKRLLQRASFTPALDAEGKPLKSYFRSSVRFQMP